MIVLFGQEGLGNQLFEYAFARALQEMCGDDRICMNNWLFKKYSSRAYSLHHFKLQDNVRVMGKVRQTTSLLGVALRWVLCYPKKAIRCLMTRTRPGDEESFAQSSAKGLYIIFNPHHSFPVKPSRARVKYVFGFYLHYDYVKDILPILCREFTVKQPPSQRNAAMLSELSRTEAVCVHIRRGDYLDPKYAWLNVCNFSYYQNALNVMQKLHPNAVFYVFSNTHDDILWIKENYRFTQQVRYVDLGNADYEEFRLMSACTHFIISNSTFSWWPAVLSDKPGKDVIAPGVWNRRAEDSPQLKQDLEGMYVPGWIRVNSDPEETK